MDRFPNRRYSQSVSRLCAVFLVAALCAGWTAAGQRAADLRDFSLAGRLTVGLPGEWMAQSTPPLPPPLLLAASAPRLNFSDLLVLENRTAPAVLEFAVSDNPFLGGQAPQLDADMHAENGRRMAEHLFYFFFPPPQNCLAQTKAEFEKAWRAEQQRLLESLREKSGNEKVNAPPPPRVNVSRNCAFNPTPLDFYAYQVSAAVVFSGSVDSQRGEGRLRSFYLPPMEQVEMGGKTFFVFEAQGRLPVDRGELDRFNLPEELRGARAYFFWAIGADTPFPFARDPARKNVPLLHIVYACLSPDGNARSGFRELLGRITFGP